MEIKFGKIMKSIREENNWSLEEMAERLGTTKQALSKYERGERTPKITAAARFSEILGVPLRQLVGEEACPDASVGPPKTEEARIASYIIDKLQKVQREQALNVIRAMFPGRG